MRLVFSLALSADLFRRGPKLVLEIGSRTDLIGASFAEGFVYVDLDASPYPARDRLHASEDSYLKISVRSS